MNGASLAWNDLVRHDVRVPGSHPCGDAAADQVVGRLVHHGGHARIEQRDAHVPADVGRVPLPQRRQDAHGRVETGDHIEERDAGLRRLAVRLAGHAHQTRQGLHDDVVAGPGSRLGRIGSERRERAGHQARMRAPQLLETEPEPLHQARSEILDDDVRALDQPADERRSVRRREVGRHGPLVAVEREEVGGVVSGERRSPMPGVVAFAGALDLDHVRAEVCKEQGAERTGQDAGEIDDANACERSGRGRGLLEVRHGTRVRLHEGPHKSGTAETRGLQRFQRVCTPRVLQRSTRKRDSWHSFLARSP